MDINEHALLARNVALILQLAGLAFAVLRGYRVSLLTVAIVSCCLFFYIWLHPQFVREHERKELELYIGEAEV